MKHLKGNSKMTKEQIAIAIALLTSLIYVLPDLIAFLFPDYKAEELRQVQKLIEQFVKYLISYLSGLTE